MLHIPAKSHDDPHSQPTRPCGHVPRPMQIYRLNRGRYGSLRNARVYSSNPCFGPQLSGPGVHHVSVDQRHTAPKLNPDEPASTSLIPSAAERLYALFVSDAATPTDSHNAQCVYVVFGSVEATAQPSVSYADQAFLCPDSRQCQGGATTCRQF